jgi:hypothetical protein
MRLMIATLVAAFLAIVDFDRYHGQHKGQVLDFVEYYTSALQLSRTGVPAALHTSRLSCRKTEKT